MRSYCAILHHIADERQPNESAGHWPRRQSVDILIFQMARTERQREAAEFRAQGSEKNQEIRARSMQAYEAGLRPDNTRLVLPPDSHFFRFFAGPSPAPGSK
jgi:hypothetical protein